MKTKNLIRAVAIVVIAALSLSFFSSCKEKEEKNESGAKKWECILSDESKITLYIYESENKYYSTLSGTPQIEILFGDSIWQYYQMNGDTMLIIKSGDIIIDPDGSSPKWEINNPSNTVMIMKYLGVLPAIATIKTEYVFNLKNLAL